MPPAPPRQRERRDGMADSPALGQNVPNLNPEPSGLYLMDGIAGLRSLPEHSVDMRERPSVLEGLKRPIPPRSMEKKPRQQEQEAR